VAFRLRSSELIFFFFFLFFLFETGSRYAAQAGLHLMILLPQLPDQQGHKCVLPHVASKLNFGYSMSNKIIFNCIFSLF
jgi:hypothetical protein